MYNYNLLFFSEQTRRSFSTASLQLFKDGGAGWISEATHFIQLQRILNMKKRT